MTCRVAGIIDSHNAALCGILSAPKSNVLVIKPIINDTDNDAAAIVGLRQAKLGTAQDLTGMSDAQRAIGTQLHELAEVITKHSRNLS